MSTTGWASGELLGRLDWDSQRWDPPARRVLPGLVIYARAYDGTFAVWDPARGAHLRTDESWRGPSHIFLDRTGIWHGKLDEGPLRPRTLAL